MREYLLKNVCHEIKEIISLEINIKSLRIALYLFFASLICYAMKFILNFILPSDYNNPADIFSTILDPHSLFLYCAIASATMMISIVLNTLKVPSFIRLGINETDVILPVLSIFYICFIMSTISFIFGVYDFRYMVFYLCVIIAVNLAIFLYRMPKIKVVSNILSKNDLKLLFVTRLIFSILMVIYCLQDVNISS